MIAARASSAQVKRFIDASALAARRSDNALFGSVDRPAQCECEAGFFSGWTEEAPGITAGQRIVASRQRTGK